MCGGVYVVVTTHMLVRNVFGPPCVAVLTMGIWSCRGTQFWDIEGVSTLVHKCEVDDMAR